MIQLRSRSSTFAGWHEGSNPVILPLTENPNLPGVLARKHCLLINTLDDVPQPQRHQYRAVLVKEGKADETHPTVVLDRELLYLVEGDVVRLNPVAHEVNTLFRLNSSHNSLLVTERCNSFCLMCSQPPRDIDDSYLADEVCKTISLIPRGTESLGITGGEPTLLGESFLKIVRQARNFLPETLLHVLTNGRNFHDRHFARELAQIKHPQLMLGIPLYSDQPDLHDFVVQARRAFDETIKGIINLKAEGVKIELRVVIHQQTYARLPELARFIARNLTFVDHVALMGLELTGFTRSNLKSLWIDPYSYRNQLAEAIRILDGAGVPVMVYNHQLCVLPSIARRFAVKSISDWKNAYLDKCTPCIRKKDCGGFFSSGIGLNKHSDYIRPFVEQHRPAEVEEV